ncbi:MAG: hypothetical protein C0480_04250 [Bradyrhizobium sp.]|nr:hypothetical protein [Bradyrhizobium sp.]
MNRIKVGDEKIDAAIEKAKPAPKKSRQQQVIDELNEKYCVVQDGSRVRVHSFERHEQAGHKRLISTFLSFAEFRNLLMNRTIKHDEGFIEFGELWLRSPKRRQYSGITFQPAGAAVINGRMNLWQGWGVTPKPGDWSRMRDHMFEVLAAGDDEAYQYLMCWLAWCVQHPDRRAEVAVVFKGRRGTGKGTLGNAMCRIFGQHAVHISSADHLTGRFNSHLRDACFLFCDEAYFPGTLSAEGDLKRKITEPSLFIEAKGRDGIEVTNMLHIMIASNEAWIIPAGESERRFVQFNVSDVHMQDSEWFDPLFKQLVDGGLAAMLFDLLHHNLADWHPRNLPANTNLLEQQRLSLRPLDAWFVELLESGVLAGSDPDQPHRARSGKWHKEVDSGDYTRTVLTNGLLDDARLIEPRLRAHISNNQMGEYLRGWGCDNTRRVLRERGWTFPPLAELRTRWMKLYPAWEWRNPSITEWQPEEADDPEEKEEIARRRAEREAKQPKTIKQQMEAKNVQ